MFRVVKCPHCFLAQVTGNSKSLICQKCGKSRTLNNLKIFYQTNNNLDAAKFLAKLKKEEAISKGKYSEDFKSVI